MVMLKCLPKKFDFTNAFVAVGVWLVVLIVYWLTKAPTVSFWDCGEFIAASYVLGIPHPPGTPLYIMFGRIFSLLPLASDIAVRINLLSSIASSFAALFGYLVAVRLLRECISETGSLLARILIYGGAAAGAFFFAFSLTNWNNSVETEVYGLSMMIFMAIFWLAMVYRENMENALGRRVMILIFYLGFAGIGAHMSTFLVVPAAALLVIFKKDVPRHVWFIVGAILLVALYLIFAMSSLPDEIPYYVPIVVVLAFYLFYIFSFEKVPGVYLVIAAGLMLSILPLAAVFSARGSDSGSAMAILRAIGVASFVGLNAMGLYLLLGYLRHRVSEERNIHHLIASIFVLTAGILTAVLVLNIRGYTAFLVALAVLGLMTAAGFYRYINWPVLIAVASSSLVILGVKEMVVGMAVAAVAVPVVGIVFKQPGWRNALLIVLVAILGYSIHVFIPIRSAEQPVINENNPSQSLDATIYFIERKQYGSQSMVPRMFERRAEWANQFGDYRRMGFWGFFKEQYGLTGIRFVPLFVIGLYGLWELLRKRTQYGIPFLILIFLASVGLVLYMNFADGTRQHPITGADYIEVRNRDYFFTPAFILFGLAIGIGLASVIQFIREALAKSDGAGRKIVVYASLILLLLPGLTLSNNYFLSDRSRNYMAFDYGWNILTSAEPNAVLITVGDNDTFPLWCIQEAYGIRKDVDVVNLSLANAKWYIKQLQWTLGIDLNWSEGQIDSLVVMRDQYGNIHRLQDQVVSRIITQNFHHRPVNFSVTVPASSRKVTGQSIDSMLALQGMVWRLDPPYPGGELVIDVETSYEMLMNPDKLRFRGIGDRSIYRDETAGRLTRNYLTTFMLVADSLINAGQMERAETLMETGVSRVPYSTDGVHYLAALYAEQGKRDKLRELIQSTEYGDKRWLRTIMGRMELRQGNKETAETVLSDILKEHPHYRPPLEDLLRLYYSNREIEKMKTALATWLANNPDDAEMKGLQDNLQQYIEAADSVSGSN